MDEKQIAKEALDNVVELIKDIGNRVEDKRFGVNGVYKEMMLRILLKAETVKGNISALKEYIEEQEKEQRKDKHFTEDGAEYSEEDRLKLNDMIDKTK